MGDVLISGSWDGTAKLWDVSTASSSSSNHNRLLDTLENHENTVSVAGTEKGAVTVSAGIAQGSTIKQHATRIWRYDSVSKKATVVSKTAEDHAGPIRDVCYDNRSIYTCSNDGTVKIRNGEDGTTRTTLGYPGDNPPMLLSVCVIPNDTRVVAAGEDGNVIVWDTSGQADVQIIPHPGCVWDVIPLSNGDFCTACHDGQLRIFTRNVERAADPDVLESFEESVAEARASRSTGPTAEEIAKLPKWEMNSLTQGRSEGQVQVFNKGGTAVAAQWSADSRTWIEVGEVTGQSANAGSLNGVRYDHVLPIEIDTADGGVAKLSIGYNNGDNPFVTAQAFIDEHGLNQGYLSQIADYIRQRSGETGPTLGGTSNGGSSNGGGSAAAAAAAPMAVDTTPNYEHLPMKGYKFFDAGVDKKGLTKVLHKIGEFNASVSSKPLSSADQESLDSLADTLSITNRYHSTTVSNLELAPLTTMIVEWDASHAFPALDLARMAVLHPDAARAERCGYWKELLSAALTKCLGLGDEVVKEVAVPMLTMRLVCNSYRGGKGAADAAGSLVERYVFFRDILIESFIVSTTQSSVDAVRIFETITPCVLSDNKNVRLSLTTAILNTSSYMYSSSSSSTSWISGFFNVIDAILCCGKYESEAISRVLVALGTVLLIPGVCGDAAKRIARDKSMISTAERVASGHDVSISVAKDIRSILS